MLASVWLAFGLTCFIVALFSIILEYTKAILAPQTYLRVRLAFKPTKTNTNKTTSVKPIGIKVGDKTHHQDQSMVPTSFSTTNIRVKMVPTPIPLLFTFTLLITFIFAFLIIPKYNKYRVGNKYPPPSFFDYL